MKSVIISIRPEWCEKILNGEKTIEVRKSAPKELPIKAYIYETKGSFKKGRGKVIGEFICDKVDFVAPWGIEDIPLFYSDKWVKEILKKACLTCDEAIAYQGNKSDIYAWHISDLKIYDTPKELSEFNKKCKHFDKIECVGENYVCYACKYFGLSFYDGFPYCVKNGKIPITRPPQSWQYMED